ncbi:MAG: hypothetical protein ACJAZK_000093 [Psychroserpens sp.]|jgi:hypothetical protein|uniref:DUF6428 family protein n=1 Tax=Psychroserpens sp. TaxID=2020870 RepID=UPI0039E56902
MKTLELFSILEQHQDKTLLFEYTSNKFIGANYHITEVKHIKVDSVDCGAQTDSWNETIIQLWESPLERNRTKYMSVLKALAILKTVGKMRSYDLASEIKFEYSNASFHTAQLFVNEFKIEENKVIFQLGTKKTDCKAKELCGVPEMAIDRLEKETVEVCCDPSSNCC